MKTSKVLAFQTVLSRIVAPLEHAIKFCIQYMFNISVPTMEPRGASAWDFWMILLMKS